MELILVNISWPRVLANVSLDQHPDSNTRWACCSADVADFVEDDDSVLDTPVPAVMSLGTPTAERQTSAKGQDSHPQEAVDKAAPEEDPMEQLLPQEDMELSISNAKRAPCESEELLPKRKRSSEEPTFDISLVAVNGLVAELQGLREDVTKSTRKMVRVDTARIETDVFLSKTMDSMTRLNGNEKEEKRKEERRLEADRRKEEERENGE